MGFAHPSTHDTSVRHFLSHVKICSDTKERIITLQKKLLKKSTLNNNMKKLQNIPVNMVNASRL